MAVNSINNASTLLTLLSALSKANEAASAPPSSPAASPGSSSLESQSLQNLFRNDGFEALSAGGTPDLAQSLQALTDTLQQLQGLLGGGESSAQGVPDLGGKGGAPVPQSQALTDTLQQLQDLLGGGESSAQGVPDLGGKDGAPAPQLQALTDTLQQLQDLLGGGESSAQGVPDLGGGGAPAPQQGAPAPQQGAPAPSTESAKTTAPQQSSGKNPAGGAGNSMDFTNDSNKPMTVTFTPNAGLQQIPPKTLQPGESLHQEFPQGWAGNVRSTKGDGSAATLGEVKFNGDGNKTFFDVSYIEGNNASMTMAAKTGEKSGTMDNLVNGAPDSILAKDANGQAFGIKKTTNAEAIDPGIVDYYRGKVGTGDGYVVPKDDASTKSTTDNHLEVHLKDVF